MPDLFRYCTYCGADCYRAGAPDYSYAYDEDVEHAPDCPTVTGLFPVTDRTFSKGYIDDGYAPEGRCFDCGHTFEIGDIYTLRPTGDPDKIEMVCVGCRVLNPGPVDA